jgi:hypothetical protein
MKEPKFIKAVKEPIVICAAKHLWREDRASRDSGVRSMGTRKRTRNSRYISLTVKSTKERAGELRKISPQFRQDVRYAAVKVTNKMHQGEVAILFSGSQWPG